MDVQAASAVHFESAAARAAFERLKVVTSSRFARWLFTIGFVRMAFWKGVTAVVRLALAG